MSEENTIESSVVPPAIETSEEGKENGLESSESGESVSASTHSDKPAGYDPVDPETASPQEIKRRFDYLFSQIKHSQREKNEMNRILGDQSRVINELSEGQKTVVNHLTQKSFADGKQQLQQQMQDAWQKQDNRSYIEAQNKLMDLQVEERLIARTQPQNPQPQNQPNNAAEIANRAAQTGELNHDEYRMTESWQSEKDENGNLLRPWAFGTDPTHQAALFEARSVMANPRLAHLTYEQKLQEIDKRMGTQKRIVASNVIGGSLTKHSKTAKIQLTSKQREIALKTHYAGKGKPEAEHLEKYRQQIEKFQQRRAK